MTQHIPAKGDRVDVHELHGYKLVQDRPFDCRPSCKCGKCNGQSTTHEGTVEKVYYYADNSVEAEVLCDDGKYRVLHLVAPHGDACY